MSYRAIVALTLAGTGIVAAKQYFGGTTCKVSRDLTGKVAIVTGGNTGIGKETAVGLAKMGCQVVIAARDVEKSLAAVQEIRQRTNNPNVYYMYLDLASKASIDNFVDQVKEGHQNVNFLVNNAGVTRIPERRQTTDGFQMQMGINHLGHFYLTAKLWDLLKVSKDLRIVNVSSEANRRVPLSPGTKVQLKWDNLNYDFNYDPAMAYSRSKLANILFTQQLARRLVKINPDARCVALHPGVVRTQIGRYFITGMTSWLVKLATPILMIVTKSPQQGAQTTLYTIFQSVDKLRNGEYYSECQLDPTKNPFALVEENQQMLWDLSSKMLGIQFPADGS